jgi:NAD(P)-dependent dehydrogenase (short-subunit alcohol dehydrogenase family)
MTTNSSIAPIAGGTSGIGRAAANKLAQLGFHVLVVSRNRERGEKTVTEIRAAGGQADFIAGITSDIQVELSAADMKRGVVAGRFWTV